MKKQLFLYASGLLVLSQACNSNEKTPEVQVVTDTVTTTVTDTVAVQAEADTAAIIAFYAAQHAKDKGTVNKAKKEKGGKKVSVDSHPTFSSTDAMPAPTPTTETGATPAPAPAPQVIVVHDVEMVYYTPDQKASFPGGEAAFDKYLHDNLEYPEKAIEAGISKTVFPTLYLDEQGKPTKVEFRYEPTKYGFQDEARRILMTSPRWNPATHGGKPVKSKFTIPISFKLEY